MKSYSMSLYLTRRRLKVPKSATKPEIQVTVNIRPGNATPAMKNQYRRFWAKLISQVKDNLKAESEARGEQK